MVHFIRYLSTPQVVAAPKKPPSVNVVLAVTTDLGDAYLQEDAQILIQLHDTKTDTLLSERTFTWQGASRALKVSLAYNGKYNGREVVLHATTPTTCKALKSKSVPEIVDVWSSKLLLSDKSRSEPLVERRMPLASGETLRIWEEMGDSIARHVWDASLGFLRYFDLALGDEESEHAGHLQSLIKSHKGKYMNVLELGAGCGTVGIALTQLLKCSTVLTDLDDAMNIMHTNMQCSAITPASTLDQSVLDWGNDLSEVCSRTWDLILVSDCIYNPDSSVLLVKTLVSLAAHAPDALILVGFKRRHSGDDVFFEHMAQANFQVIDRYNVDLPHIVSDLDAYAPVIEFHVFQGQETWRLMPNGGL
jgi:predicted nicotinamide N-methyase